MSIVDRIATLAASSPRLDRAEAEAVLEIAFLAVNADGKIQPVEESALRAFAGALVTDGERAVDRLFDGGIERDREAADARLLAAAKRLGSEAARALAYKVSYAVALSDLASADEEFEFDLQLIDALGLEQARADALAGEVVAALHPA